MHWNELKILIRDLRVNWFVFVFVRGCFAMDRREQTTKSHEPGITKRHKDLAEAGCE